MHYALIGLGAAGSGLAVSLARAGQEISGWFDSDAGTRSAVDAAGGLSYEGIAGQGAVALPTASGQAADAIDGAAVIVVSTTADRHEEVAQALALALRPDQLVILHCGYVGGARMFAQALEAAGGITNPMLGELNNTVHLCGKINGSTVAMRAEKRWLELAADAATLRHTSTQAFLALFPGYTSSEHALESGLNNPNAIGHVPATIGNAVLIGRELGEMTTGLLHFEEARLGKVNTIAAAFEAERDRLIAALGLKPLPSSVFSARAYPAGSRLFGGVSRFGPKLQSRFLTEDLPCSLVPMESLGRWAGCPTPVTTAMIELSNIIAGIDFRAGGRTVERFGEAWVRSQTRRPV